MKKLTYLFLILALYGCTSTCLIAQPPQTLRFAEGCQVAIPDYTLRVNITDNCQVKSIVQTPAAGFLLTATNPITTVKITATDISNNISSISFTVTAIDDIPPVIAYDSLLADIEPIMEMYDRADEALNQYSLWYDTQFPGDSLGIAANDTIRINYAFIPAK
jgi:hypothetical protein